MISYADLNRFNYRRIQFKTNPNETFVAWLPSYGVENCFGRKDYTSSVEFSSVACQGMGSNHSNKIV